MSRLCALGDFNGLVVGILMSWLCALGDFNGLVGRNIDELVVFSW